MSKKKRATSLENIFVSETHRVIYTEISYLKRRIHLVEGERRANYESNEETLKNNEVKLKEIKESNLQLKSQKKLMLQSKETFVKEISAKLGGEKKAYEFKDKKFDDVMDILECKIGTLRNKQNYLKYNKTKQKKQMMEVVEEEESLKTMIMGKDFKPSNEKKLHSSVQKRLNEIKSTETGTAAMLMKITEADNIRTRYKNMMSLLKSENFILNLKVNEYDKKLGSEIAEIESIRQVLQESLKAKKFAKSRLTEIEEATIKDYSEREQQLYDARIQLKTIREKMEQIGSKLSFPKFHMIHRDSSVTEGLYIGYQKDDKRESKSQNVVEIVYLQLANMIGEADPALIVVRFQEQRDHAKELLEQEETAKSVVRKAKLRKRFLLDKLSQLQYSGGLKREKLNARFGKISAEMEITVGERDTLNKWLEEHSQAMDHMLTKLQEICQTNEIKILQQNLSSEVPAENVENTLKLVLKQLEKFLGAGLEGSFSFSPYSSIMLPQTPAPNQLGLEEVGGTLIPFEISTEGPTVFNLPSPVGSSTSFRLSDFEGGGAGMIEGGGGQDLSPDFLSSYRDRAPSIMIHPEEEHEQVLKEAQQQQRDDSAGMKTKGGGRGDSSEEEEAVSRNFVKRQSQILFEAKTRKGRFNGSAGGVAGSSGASSVNRNKY